MLGREAAGKALQNLFRRSPVVDLETLCRALKTQSRMSVYRRLRDRAYLASYTHAGGYYTLPEIPRFDEDGLWLYRDIGCSRAGTLKNTVAHLVEIGEAGRTHRELQQLLRVRLHNTLLSLVREERIGRQRLESMYLYLSVEAERASHQVAARRELLASSRKVALPLAPSVLIEVLVEVIQTARLCVTPTEVAKRLAVRGVAVTPEQVDQLFHRYELGSEKKTGQ